MARLVENYFGSNGSWTAPAGVTRVFLIGQGAGGGGSGGCIGTVASIAHGGNGTSPIMVQVSVVPNTTYSITIGTGGTGGLGNRTSSTQNGTTGGNTTFGSLYTFLGGQFGSIVTGRLGTVRTTSSPVHWSHSAYLWSDNTQQPLVSSHRGGNAGVGGDWTCSPAQAAGGTANSSGTGAVGSNGTGRGQGGGGGGAGSVAGGVGGTGSNGQLWVIWVE